MPKPLTRYIRFSRLLYVVSLAGCLLSEYIHNILVKRVESTVQWRNAPYKSSLLLLFSACTLCVRRWLGRKLGFTVTLIPRQMNIKRWVEKIPVVLQTVTTDFVCVRAWKFNIICFPDRKCLQQKMKAGRERYAVGRDVTDTRQQNVDATLTRVYVRAQLYRHRDKPSICVVYKGKTSSQAFLGDGAGLQIYAVTVTVKKKKRSSLKFICETLSESCRFH